MRNMRRFEMPDIKKDVFRKAGFLRPLIILYEKPESVPILQHRDFKTRKVLQPKGQ